MKITKQLVPQEVVKSKTYGLGNKKKGITIHQTGNTTKGAGAKAHANLQSKGNVRSASWHYSVDDKDVIQSFNHGVKCWHAGDGKGFGNTQTIGIELCINSDADYKKTLENGAALVSKLLKDENLTIKDVYQHFDHSGKNCPAQIRAGNDGIAWNDFLKMVEADEPVKEETKKDEQVKEESTVKVISTADKGKRVESIYNGNDQINFYKEPSFDKPIGTFGYGMGWIVVEKIQVDKSEMFKVKNSRGDIYYITARKDLVKVLGRDISDAQFDRLKLATNSKETDIDKLKALVEFKRQLRADRAGYPAGEEVKQIQRVVGVKVDGIYGPVTAKAVEKYQRVNGLQIDRVFGRQTFSHMFYKI